MIWSQTSVHAAYAVMPKSRRYCCVLETMSLWWLLLIIFCFAWHECIFGIHNGNGCTRAYNASRSQSPIWLLSSKQFTLCFYISGRHSKFQEKKEKWGTPTVSPKQELSTSSRSVALVHESVLLSMKRDVQAVKLISVAFVNPKSTIIHQLISSLQIIHNFQAQCSCVSLINYTVSLLLEQSRAISDNGWNLTPFNQFYIGEISFLRIDTGVQCEKVIQQQHHEPILEQNRETCEVIWIIEGYFERPLVILCF